MALILHLETSTKICSAALSLDGNLLFSKTDRNGPSHAVQLGLFVDEALKVVEDKGLKLEAVAVSSGPGSYTGLRIGVSIAKGVAYGADAKVITIPTLDLMADQLRRQVDLPPNALICPMLDARRMEVYTALYNAQGQCVKPVDALVIDETSFADQLSNQPIWFVGDGAAKCQATLTSDRAHFETTIDPLAEAMMFLAEKAYNEHKFADVAYFEPFYLKDFVATVSKKPMIPTR